MPRAIAPGMLSWASELDDATIEQAARTARLPIVAGHVALMPDAHLGMGATIGSVIPTETAVIPSAVGVDIGCGMAARLLAREDGSVLRVEDLPEAGLDRWVTAMANHVPAGLGRWRSEPTDMAREWLRRHPPPPTLRHEDRAGAQLGTLGSGNHFVEVAEDERGRVWILLHSGSRGGGNQLATMHTKTAARLHRGLGTELEDPELAWLQSGSPEFDAYIRDLGWAQAYARENRRLILIHAQQAFEEALARPRLTVADEVNCHHNYTELEVHGGRRLWVTRKGAIRAGVGDRGLIPGSMGQRSNLVRGKGDVRSYRSCAHGAGRRLSRRVARRTLSVERLTALMGASAWQAAEAASLLDESPEAYKPIDAVMADQAELVEIEHELRGLANYKGIERGRR